MKFCYRGVSYEKKPVQFKIVDTGEVAKFRGGYYMVHRTAMNLVPQDKSGLVYRGVPEDKGKHTVQFLGCKYNISHVFVQPIKAQV
jgi:hypothetical protein